MTRSLKLIALWLLFVPSVEANPCDRALDSVDASNSALNGTGVVVKDLGQFCDNLLMAELEKGNTLTYLAMLKSLNTLTQDEWRILKTVAPLSSFQNQKAENNVDVPNLDKETPQDLLREDPSLNRFKAIILKSSYLMPGVRSEQISPELMASNKYQESCQPGFPKKTSIMSIDQTKYPTTFRINKEVFKIFLVPYRITIQMKASEIRDQDTLKKLADLDNGTPISKAILLERTRADSSKSDGSKVVKSLQIYRDVKGGVLVQNYTAVLNDQLPGGILSSVITYFGGKNAADESAETANRTRSYLRQQ